MFIILFSESLEFRIVSTIAKEVSIEIPHEVCPDSKIVIIEVGEDGIHVLLGEIVTSIKTLGRGFPLMLGLIPTFGHLLVGI